jgi:CarD family transcriptional regulator
MATVQKKTKKPVSRTSKKAKTSANTLKTAKKKQSSSPARQKPAVEKSRKSAAAKETAKTRTKLGSRTVKKQALSRGRATEPKKAAKSSVERTPAARGKQKHSRSSKVTIDVGAAATQFSRLVDANKEATSTVAGVAVAPVGDRPVGHAEKISQVRVESVSAVKNRDVPGPAGKPAKTGLLSKTVNASDTKESGQKLAKNSMNRQGFKTNEFVVYPAHGVGQIVSIEEQEVAGFTLELFVINFAKDKMTLRVPTSKVSGVGMRKLSDSDSARKSLDILMGRPRIKRTMWSRRAQEYESKINSGDIDSIAEVVRDLYRSEAQPEQSYSERQLYEAALDRMAREIAVVQELDESEALKVIVAQLQKGQKRASKVDIPVAMETRDSGVDEAA